MILLLSLSCSQKKAVWKGTIVEDANDITVVHNPKEPIYEPDVLSLEEELSIGEVEGEEEYMFQSIFTLAVNDRDDIYVMDSKAKHIKMFGQDGKYLKTIGQPGQGPGEFQNPAYMFFTEQDQIIVYDMTRLSYFSQDGSFLESDSIKPTLPWKIVQEVDQEGNLFAVELNNEKGVYELKKFDPEFNYVCSFGTSPLPVQTGKRDPFFSVLRFDIINGDQVLFGYAGKGYILEIMDKTAKLVKRIENDYTPVKVTQEDIEKRAADYPPEVEFSSPKYFPPFSRIVADDEGRVYVQTYEKTLDGEKYNFDIFDSQGRYILKVPFKSRPHIIKNNKFYSIEENEKGYQFVKRYKMSWTFPP